MKLKILAFAVALMLATTLADAVQTGNVLSWGGFVIPVVQRGTRFTNLATGDYHSLALKSDGTVVAWGNNNYGQSTVPVGLNGVVAIAAGGYHSLELKSDGTVVAWGYNYYGQSTVPSGLNGVVAIAAGYMHNLALKSDGTVVAWGENDYGESTVPTGLNGVVAIAAEGDHSLALKGDGTVVAWGNNGSGQSTVPAGLNDVVAIAAGYYHSLALKSDGTVVAWGNNGSGQSTVPAGLTGVVAIAAGGEHSLALKSDGTVVAWGDNTFGESTVPAGLNGVVAIAAAGQHSLGLKSDGTVVAWGDNGSGESTVPGSLNGMTAIATGYGSLALNSDGTVVAWVDNGSGESKVPEGLNGVVAIAAGFINSLALKSDGTVVAWGDNDYGESTVPGGLSGVVAIAAGGYHSLALKSDGTVVAWGDNSFGESTVPAGLNGVVAIAAGGEHSLALKSDGTVVAWGYNYYGQSTVPGGLNGVVAIAAGYYHSLALKSDGTVVAWGNNAYGGSTVPGGLNGVVAIAAGYAHSLALKGDGTVVAWGYNNYGESTVPAGLNGVVAIAAGNAQSLAIIAAPNQSPNIVTSPRSQTAQFGSNVSFTVSAVGTLPLNYQWQFNGQNIPNATNATLTLNSVTAANSGGYSVVVSNPYGSVTSATASLAVLTDGANGNTPVQPTRSSIPAKSSSAKNLVFITHGWQWKLFYPTAPPSQPWMAEMTNDIAQQLQAKGQLSNWQFETYSWLQDAWTYDPDTALNTATEIGAGLGIQIAAQGWQQVHLIAHSAGAGMIQEIADKIHANSPSTVVQTTFLDPFTGLDNWALSWYGSNAAWSDEYYVAIDETSLDPIATGFPLPKTFAVDVSWVDPNHQQAQYIGPGGGPVALSSHGYPIDFYTQSIINTDPNWSGAGYGFILSMEDDGANWINTQINNPVGSGPVLPNSPANAVRNPNSGLGEIESVELGIIINLGNAAYAASGPAATLIGDAGLELQSIWSALPLVKSGGVQPMGGPVPLGGSSSTNAPAWLAVGVNVTNAVNFVQFGAAFTDTNSAQGLLTVYWNTNQIGMVDERVAATNLQTYRFQLPGTVSSGLYTLSFRLDSFNNSSSIAVTNVATGFVGVTQPITLGISLTNGVPLLQLTAATNFTYLIQSSTNLVDWTPTALLLNTNGTVQFLDSVVTNSGTRFYRAVMQ